MKLTKSQRADVFSMFGGRCAYCGSELKSGWHADHVVSCGRRRSYDRKKRDFVSTGEFGRPEANRLENFFPSCPPCNIDKRASSLEGWRSKLSQSCDVLKRNHSTYRFGLTFGLITENQVPVVFYFERLSAEASA